MTTRSFEPQSDVLRLRLPQPLSNMDSGPHARRRISISDVTEMATCSRRYELARDRRDRMRTTLPLNYRVQKTVEMVVDLVYRSRMLGSDLSLDGSRLYECIGAAGHHFGLSYDDVMAQVQPTVMGFLREAVGPASAQLVGVGVPFWVDIPETDCILTGYLPVIAKPDGYVLVINRAVHRAWDAEKLVSDVRVSLLALGAIEILRPLAPKFDILLRLLIAPGKRKEANFMSIPITRTSEMIQSARAVLRGVALQIQAEAFWPSFSWACKDCSFRAACGLPGAAAEQE